jgi:hypothetical protein
LGLSARKKIEMNLLDNHAQFYYETHLTFDPKNAEVSYEDFARTAREAGWKASKFEHDDVDGIEGMWFMSHRCDNPHEIIVQENAGVPSDLKNEIIGWIHGASCNGLDCVRWKVERTVADSKLGHRVEDL